MKNKYTIEYHDYKNGYGVFELLAPMKPHANGGTEREILFKFEHEGEGSEIREHLNELLDENKLLKTDCLNHGDDAIMRQLKRIDDLRSGDIVRGKATGNVFHVIAIYGDRATAVQVQDLTNPDEWEVLEQSQSNSAHSFTEGSDL